jgi:hypothetical protein
VQLKLNRAKTRHENHQVMSGLQFQAELVRDRNVSFTAGKRPATAVASWGQQASWAGDV